jgi:UDP-N-acetylmuramate dehydrogenase
MSVLPSVQLNIQKRIALAPYTSLKVGGPADHFVEVRSIDEAAALLRWAAVEALPVRWLGGGSNVLVADSGLGGIAARFLGSSVELPAGQQGDVRCEAGVRLSWLTRTLARAGWQGLEWAANIPGTVGGAVVNNAGAFDSCVADVLSWVELLDEAGGVERLSASDLGFAYRTSRLKRGDFGRALVCRVAVRLARTSPSGVMARIKTFERLRTETQPRQRSAGSVFANPPGDFAGRLIEVAGLKGHRLAGAQISERHANFIVNLATASADDVYRLVRFTQDTVYQRLGCWLNPEIELVGRWSVDQRQALSRPSGLDRALA